MDRALVLAERCLDAGDVPVGAVVLAPDGTVVGEGRNRREATGDATAHAEVDALRSAAGALGQGWRLPGATVVVTLEPCVMCTGALVAARAAGTVFGAWDDKAGACGSVWDLARDPLSLHRLEVTGGLRAEESAALLRRFFAGRR
ncbi:nucleoside deaminase [Aquipuribacter hungaricus]|uniref:tRNA-specific adenosine deaminase n=1 Tax=Aquipuribacter hungaricus TaxID=545624 RepID=A0ABV7WJP9_9MICO